MKNRRVLLAVFVLLALVVGVGWIFLAGNPASPTANEPVTKTSETHQMIPANAWAVEMPKAAPAKVVDTKSGRSGEAPQVPSSAAVRASTARDIVAEREKHREAVEQQMETVISHQEELIRNAKSDEELQKDKKDLEDLRLMYQDRLDELAQPAPPPLDFGDIPLVDGMSSAAKMADYGDSYTLTPTKDSGGNWKIKVTMFGGKYGPIYELVSVTPGQPMVIDEGNDLEIHFTPRLLPETASNYPSAPPQGSSATSK